MTSEICIGPGCDRFVRFSSYCDSHYKMLKRTGELRPLRKYHRWPDLRGYLHESAVRFAAARDDAEKRAAQRDLERAAVSWGRRASRVAT